MHPKLNVRINESSKLTFFWNIHIEGYRPPYIDTLKSIKGKAVFSEIRW